LSGWMCILFELFPHLWGWRAFEKDRPGLTSIPKVRSK